MPPAPTITSRADYDVLRLFADGRSEIEIADATGLSQKAVTSVVNGMCAGDQVVARQLVTAYEHRARAVAAAQSKPGVPGLPRTTSVPPAPGRPAPVAPARDPLAEMLAAAAASPQQRTRALGDKVRTLLADLRTRLAEERKTAERAEAAAKARAEAERRVAELAAELEKAREALRTANGRPARPASAAPAAAGEVPAKTVRAWAQETGVEVPALGRIPRTVMDAYLAAHPATDPEGQ